MILTQSVRCILLAVYIILQLSEKTKCVSFEVKNHDEIQTIISNDTNLIPQILEDNVGDWKSGLTSKAVYSDVLTSKKTEDDFQYDRSETKCSTTLCAFLQKHRVIRQTNTGYSHMYPQLPTSYPYRHNNNTYPFSTYNQQNNSFGFSNPGYSPYSSYPKPAGPVVPSVQRPTPNQPFYNSTNYPYPNNNNYSYNYHQAHSASPKHTYPPSPRPPQNQAFVNNRPNATYYYKSTNNTNPYNGNDRRTNFSGNVSNSNYPFPNYAGTGYSAVIQKPPLNQTFGHNKTNPTNFYNPNNIRPFNYSSNIPNNNNSFASRNNSLSLNNNQRTPYNTNPLPYSNSNKNTYSSYPYNVNQGFTYSPSGSLMNSSQLNYYGPQTYYPTTANFTQRHHGQHTLYNLGLNQTYNGFNGHNP